MSEGKKRASLNRQLEEGTRRTIKVQPTDVPVANNNSSNEHVNEQINMYILPKAKPVYAKPTSLKSIKLQNV